MAIAAFMAAKKKHPDCRGHLRKLVAKVTDALCDPYEQLLALLPERLRGHLANVLETNCPKE